MKDEHEKIKKSYVGFFLGYCIYFYDIRLIHLLIDEITQLGIITVYKSLMWKCYLLYAYYPDTHHCTPIRPHEICIGNWVKDNFKYRVNRVLSHKISSKERFTTKITLPSHATRFVSKYQSKGPWCLEDVLSQSFTIYDN